MAIKSINLYILNDMLLTPIHIHFVMHQLFVLCLVNNYTVRSYRDEIVVTNIVTRRTNEA